MHASLSRFLANDPKAKRRRRLRDKTLGRGGLSNDGKNEAGNRAMQVRHRTAKNRPARRLRFRRQFVRRFYRKRAISRYSEHGLVRSNASDAHLSNQPIL